MKNRKSGDGGSRKNSSNRNTPDRNDQTPSGDYAGSIATPAAAGTLLPASSLSLYFFALVEELINRGMDVNDPSNVPDNDEGKTMLHWAAEFDSDGKVMAFLLRNGANPNSRDRNGGRTPLHSAARFDQAIAAETLLQAGADLSALDSSNRAPLQMALEAEAFAALRVLLRHCPRDLLNAHMENGETALIKAVRLQMEDTVEDLINAGADVNMPDSEGIGPLHYAVRSGSLRTFNLLLRCGADKTAATLEGRTPLHYTAKFNRSKMAKILLDAGVDPNPLDKHGNTPLLIAAEYFMVFPFRVYTVQLLLQHPKINPHVRRVEDGKSPVMVLGILSISGRRDATSLFEDILKLGADINTQDLDGKTLMHYVMEMPEPTLHQIPRLTELGAQVDVQDNQGETPLHLAVYRGSFEGCSVLLRRFVNRDIPNRSGKLPIDVAREKGYPRIVALLNNRYIPGG